MLIVTLLYLLQQYLHLISNISKLCFCYDLTQHLICFTRIHEINQQLSCVGYTSFVCHTLKEQPELELKTALSV